MQTCQCKLSKIEIRLACLKPTTNLNCSRKNYYNCRLYLLADVAIKESHI